MCAVACCLFSEFQYDITTGISQLSLAHPVMDLFMSHQVPRLKVRMTLGETNLLTEYLLIIEGLYHHIEEVGIRGVAPYCTVGLARDTHHLAHIGAHPKPFK